MLNEHVLYTLSDPERIVGAASLHKGVTNRHIVSPDLDLAPYPKALDHRARLVDHD